MAGLYIHIPFCASRCIYCAFYSTTRSDLRQRYVDAVVAEARLRPAAGTIGTVYLGGGTPSQLTPQQLSQLLTAVYNIYKVEPQAEITVECNPDDVTPALAATLARLGVNRVSMGAQTFDDQRLRFLHRRHTARQVALACQRLHEAGITNISIDLMYGFPGQTLDQWQHDIDEALRLRPRHLSAYCLTVEEGTPLYRMHLAEADEELERQMYYRLKERLEAAGFEHYELSNFARPGYRSRHNSSYWTDVPYIGLGAAAHSYLGTCRQWNPDDILLYIKGIESGSPVTGGEQLDAATRYNDRVMLSLRTREGIGLDLLDSADRRFLLSQARPHLQRGLLLIEGNRLRLSSQGLFVSNMLTSDLMRV